MNRLEREYVQLHDILTSGYVSQWNTPQWYVRWAQDKEIPIPWLDWAKAKGLVADPPPKPTVDAPSREKPDIRTRERDTVEKIIAGFLVRGFTAAEIEKPYTIAKDIRQSLEASGIQLSDDTIAKWIKKAVERLPK